MRKTLGRELAAELLGTFVLLSFGLGSVAQSVLSHSKSGNFLTINLAWGFAVIMGIYIAGSISGAHLNPAITITMAIHRNFSWRKVLPYTAAQMAGAFIAAAVVYITYREALTDFDGGIRQVTGAQATAGVWATYPQDFLSSFPGGLIDQIVGTGLFTLIVFALTDARNKLVSPLVTPCILGAAVMLIGMTFGFNSGYAINPARDLAPRLFTAIAGWGSGVFTAGNYWWWVPVAGPIAGAVGAGYIYDFLFRPASSSEMATT